MDRIERLTIDICVKQLSGLLLTAVRDRCPTGEYTTFVAKNTASASNPSSLKKCRSNRLCREDVSVRVLGSFQAPGS